MRPIRYHGKVVGVTTYEKAITAKLERVRKLGRKNAKNMADPTRICGRACVFTTTSTHICTSLALVQTGRTIFLPSLTWF